MSGKSAEEVEKIERRSVQESEDELSVEEMRDFEPNIQSEPNLMDALMKNKFTDGNLKRM